MHLSPGKTLVLLFLGLVLGFFHPLALALSQEDMRIILSPAFAKHSRPAALFMHDKHNEKAGLEDCAVCHHGKDENGMRSLDDGSPGTPCAECHAAEQADGTPLMRAYHQQCIACHERNDKGPTHCGGCHPMRGRG
jgi:hypothetical protein